MAETMLTFHGKQELKDRRIAQVRARCLGTGLAWGARPCLACKGTGRAA